MQVVDVLRDHAVRPTRFDHPRHCIVTAIRMRADPPVRVVEPPPPRLAAHGFGRDEILEIDRLHAAPQAARTAKVRNARFSADAGAGEENDMPTAGDEVSKGGDGGVHAPSLPRPEESLHPTTAFGRRAFARKPLNSTTACGRK